MADVRHYKVDALPAELDSDAVYYVYDGQGVKEYVTDTNGVARLVSPDPGVKASEYFDDGAVNPETFSNNAQRINNTIVGLLNEEGIAETFNKVTLNDAGGAITDANVDGIIYRKKGAEYFKKAVIKSAKDFGIKGDGTDQTAKLQKAVNYSFGSVIHFDWPTATSITISGVVTVPAGKVLKFSPNNKIIGAGTINGGLIDAGFKHQIFATTLIVNPEGVTNKYFSVKWFGAVGDGIVDDYIPLQTTIDTAIRNYWKWNNVFLPQGNYRITSPLIQHNWNGTFYAFFTIHLTGEGIFWNATGGTSISPTFKNTFAMGIQLGKGCTMKGIRFTGLYTVPNAADQVTFFNLTFAQFTDPTCREDQYSAYSGLVIDPFSNSAAQIPTGGGYPGLTSYYRGTGSNEGSTGIEVRDCMFFNFAVGIFCSPNSFTQNAELLKFQLCQFGNNKICVATSQDQEKSNEIIDAACWSSSHTFFMLWGKGTCGTWHIKRVNIAGAVVRFMEVNSGGYFPINISEIFTESLGSFGIFHSQVRGVVRDCELGFVDPVNYKFYKPNHIDSSGVLFENNNIRLYGSFLPVMINGTSTYSQCRFEVTPYFGSITSNANTTPPLFIDCTVGSTRNFGLSGKTPYTTSSGQGLSMPLYGNFKVMLKNIAEYGTEVYHEIDNQQPFRLVTIQAYSQDIGTVTGANRSVTFTLAAVDIPKFAVNRVVFLSGGPGVCTALNTTTGVITVSYVSKDVVGGVSGVLALIPLQFKGGFIGNTTAGVAAISGVVMDAEFNADPSWLVGSMIKTMNRFSSMDRDVYHEFTMITGYNAGTKTFTTANNAFATETGIYFTNAVRKELQMGNFNSPINNYEIIPKGTKLYFPKGGSNEFIATKTGFWNAAAMGGGETRQYEGMATNFALENLTTYAELRARGGNTSKIVTIHDPALQGDFYPVSTDTTTADNGGTVIVTTSGLGTLGMRWYRKLSNAFINKRWYGSANIYFDSVAEANSLIPSVIRRRGLRCLILVSGVVRDYVYSEGILDANLVEVKNVSTELNNDVDFTITKGLTVLGNPLTANRTVTFPDPTISGQVIYIRNSNTAASGFNYLISGVLVLNPAGVAITALENLTNYTFVSHSGYWHLMSKAQ